MLTRALRAALPAILLGMFGLPLAHADIYTWVDASGSINISNLPPPEGARITKILRARPPEIVAREDAAREAARQAETQALAERVRELEETVARAARQAPPADYRAISPPMIQYAPEPAPPPMQQIVEVTPPAYGGCNPDWEGCALWWAPGFYGASVFVLRTPNFRGVHSVRGRNDFTVRPPGHLFGPPFGPNFAAQQPMHPLGSPQGLKRG